MTALSDKGRMILAALVYGLDGKMAEKHGVTPNKALSPYQVADIYKLRRAYVRWLMAEPVFRAEFNQALAIRKQAYIPHAIDRMAELVDSDNEPVAFKAAECMIGDVKPSLAVNVQVNTAIALKPGYVIRLPAENPP